MNLKYFNVMKNTEKIYTLPDSPKARVQNILQDTNRTCFVISSLFTKEECEELLSSEIKKSFQNAISNYPTYYRNNERFVMDNEDLANYLFQKVKSYLPGTIETSSDIQAENGVWHLKELNSRLRFCKYSANQYFHRHLDGVHYRSDIVQSKLTFMIYLNSATEFKGGRTLFFKTKETDEIWASYIPQQGDLIVFDHWKTKEHILNFSQTTAILFLVSENDRIIPPYHSRHLHEMYPDASYHIKLSKCSHGDVASHPDYLPALELFFNKGGF